MKHKFWTVSRVFQMILTAFCIVLVALVSTALVRLAELQKNIDDVKHQSTRSVTEIEVSRQDYTTSVELSYTRPSDVHYSGLTLEVYNSDRKLIQTTDLLSEPFGRIALDLPCHDIYTFSFISHYGDREYTAFQTARVLSPHYNFAYLNATMPVLLYTAQALVQDNVYPTYLLIERAATYHWDYLPENHYEIPGLEGRRTNMSGEEFIGGVEIASGYLGKLATLDEKSTFTLNYVDNYSLMPLAFFDKNEISETRCDNVIWSDGTASYRMFGENYPTTAAYKALVEEYAALREAAADMEYAELTYSEKYAFAATHYSNTTYYVQNKASMASAAPEVTAMAAARLTERTVSESFARVEAGGKLVQMEYLFHTRWGSGLSQSMSSYLNQSEKPNLLILGTSPGGEEGQPVPFEELLSYVILEYGGRYDIFYKGHPRYPSDDERKALFSRNGILELENSIPVETLMLLYEDVYVGGYSTTSFLSATPGQNLFVFRSEEDMRADPAFSSAFESGLFDGTEFIVSLP